MHAAMFATGFVDDALRHTVPSVNEPLLQLEWDILCSHYSTFGLVSLFSIRYDALVRKT